MIILGGIYGGVFTPTEAAAIAAVYAFFIASFIYKDMGPLAEKGPLYQRSPSASTDWLSRILWRNETALHFNGPHAEHGQMDFRGDLHQIACPILLMVGEEDPITPPVFSEAISDSLPKSQLTYHRFADCGHGVISDKPDEALRAVRSFIERVATES